MFIIRSFCLLVLIVFCCINRNVNAKDTKIPCLNSVKAKMQEFIDQNEISGAITIVADKHQILHQDVSGYAHLENKTPLEINNIFWIASMSKPICGAAMMKLVDEGKVSLDDPVEKYIPEFKDLKLKDGTSTQVTIKHLLTHSSGLSELSYPEVEGISKLAVAIPLVTKKPVQFIPGTQWKYCQSSINTAGRIIEVVSGKDYDLYLDETFFKPLGMQDTTFYPTEEQVKRLVSAYKFTKDKEPEKVNVSLLAGKDASSRDRIPMANGGLFSTAYDYLRFAQMLLNEGELGGHKIMSPTAVKTFRTVQIPTLVTGFTPGNGWGVGCCVVREPQGVSKSLSAGSFGHGGAYGTQAWVDPVKERIFILMVQRANFPNSDNSDVRAAFQDLATAELDK